MIQPSESARLTAPASVRCEILRSHGWRVHRYAAARAGHTAHDSSMYVWKPAAMNTP